MMSSTNNVAVVPESPPLTTRRVRTCSSTSSSSTGSKQGKGSSRKSASLPAETVAYLKAWMMSPEHIAHPYPTEQEKAKIMEDTGIELKQLTNWFVNNRKRYWKPRVEARLQQQQAQVQAAAAAVAAAAVTQTATASPARTEAVVTPVTTPYIALDMTQPRRVSQGNVSPAVDQSDAFHTPKKLSFVGSDNVTAFVPSQILHTVSEASSSSSESDSQSASNELEDETSANVYNEVDQHSGVVSRTEVVDIHILSPFGGAKPTVDDVSILPPVDVANVAPVHASRLLKLYKDRAFTYQFVSDVASDRKEVDKRREAEVLLLKKRYLKQFLDQEYPKLASSQASHKRKRASYAVEPVAPRTKYLCESPKMWRRACREASGSFDETLPSLEEAAHLFGFTQSA